RSRRRRRATPDQIGRGPHPGHGTHRAVRCDRPRASEGPRRCAARDRRGVHGGGPRPRDRWNPTSRRLRRRAGYRPGYAIDRDPGVGMALGITDVGRRAPIVGDQVTKIVQFTFDTDYPNPGGYAVTAANFDLDTIDYVNI